MEKRMGCKWRLLAELPNIITHMESRGNYLWVECEGGSEYRVSKDGKFVESKLRIITND